MKDDASDKDWKLRLRYGTLTTPYRHYTALAEGHVGKLSHGFSCPVGSAVMGMKIWAETAEESADMMRVIGIQIGFTVIGEIQVFETDPEEPPSDRPRGYDINFTPFDPE